MDLPEPPKRHKEASRMSDFKDRLSFVGCMHNKLRAVCPQSGTPEGHFVNENTVVRLAAMMDAQKLQPKGKALPAGASDAEKTVRVLFLFRHLILHKRGRMELSSCRRTQAEKDSYEWFCQKHSAARVCEGEALRLPADTVISPLVKGCIQYFQESL
jgi:hypothetical protein